MNLLSCAGTVNGRHVWQELTTPQMPPIRAFKCKYCPTGTITLNGKEPN